MVHLVSLLKNFVHYFCIFQKKEIMYLKLTVNNNIKNKLINSDINRIQFLSNRFIYYSLIHFTNFNALYQKKTIIDFFFIQHFDLGPFGFDRLGSTEPNRIFLTIPLKTVWSRRDLNETYIWGEMLVFTYVILYV